MKGILKTIVLFSFIIIISTLKIEANHGVLLLVENSAISVTVPTKLMIYNTGNEILYGDLTIVNNVECLIYYELNQSNENFKLIVNPMSGPITENKLNYYIEPKIKLQKGYVEIKNFEFIIKE